MNKGNLFNYAEQPTHSNWLLTGFSTGATFTLEVANLLLALNLDFVLV